MPKVYVNPETPFVLTDSGGDAVITLTNLDHSAGRLSAQYNRGVPPWPSRHRCHATFTMSTDHATVLHEVIGIYAAFSDGVTVDGNVGVSDAAITVDKLDNLTYLGAARADIASAAANVFTASFTVYLYDRYLSVAVWNGTSNKIASGSIKFIPVPDEIQS